MKKILTALGLFIGGACCSQSKQISFDISGNIQGLGNDSVVIQAGNYDEQGKRTGVETFRTKAADDHFHLTGSVSGTRYVWTTLGEAKARKSFSFFLEEGKISILGTINDLDNLSITGTPGNDDQTKSRKYTSEIYSRIKVLRLQLQNEMSGSKSHEDISRELNSKFDSIQAYELHFIEKNPASPASSTYLYVLQDKIPLTDLEYLYNRLSDDVKNTAFGFIVRDKIKARKLVAIGNKAPEFTSFDTSRNAVSFASFRGRYVLLEFWASWCVPCRQQSPHLVELYKKYRDKGFTIVQYSIDDDKAEQKWKEAIRKDGLVWTQLSDLSGFDSRVSKLYGVQPIPDNFLIDPDGKIIGRRLEGKELEKKLEELLEK